MSEWRDYLESRGHQVFLVPAVALLGLFVVFPLVWNVYLSLTNYSLITIRAREYDIVWFKNYFSLLRDYSFILSVRNSVVFTILSALVGQVVLGMALALVARMSMPNNAAGAFLRALRNTALVLVFVSWVIPEVVAGYAWTAITEKGGIITSMLGLDYRLYAQKPLETIIVANIWRGTAFSMVLFMAAMESIPRHIYEAAEIDGASAWQRFKFVLLPLLAPVILVDFILITIWTFSVFTQPFMILREALGKEVLWTIFIYNEALKVFDPALAATAADIMFVVVLVMILAYMAALKRVGGWSYA